MGAPRKPADSTNPVDRPDSWEKAVLAAYVRMTGGTQKEAAAAAGCSVRSIHDWERSTWWEKAKSEAIDRWNAEFVADCRAGLTRALRDPDEYATTARWGAERLIANLAPPTRKTQLTGKDEGPIEVRDARDENARTLARLASALETEGDPEQSE